MIITTSRTLNTAKVRALPIRPTLYPIGQNFKFMKVFFTKAHFNYKERLGFCIDCFVFTSLCIICLLWCVYVYY